MKRMLEQDKEQEGQEETSAIADTDESDDRRVKANEELQSELRSLEQRMRELRPDGAERKEPGNAEELQALLRERGCSDEQISLLFDEENEEGSKMFHDLIGRISHSDEVAQLHSAISRVKDIKAQLDDSSKGDSGDRMTASDGDERSVEWHVTGPDDFGWIECRAAFSKPKASMQDLSLLVGQAAVSVRPEDDGSASYAMIELPALVDPSRKSVALLADGKELVVTLPSVDMEDDQEGAEEVDEFGINEEENGSGATNDHD